jgi:hypothetical protein
MTGTTLFTISRTLSKWADFGFVIPRREGVAINDPDRLRRYAGLDEPYRIDCRRHRGPANVPVVPLRTHSTQ